jgi:hypothetical protein
MRPVTSSGAAGRPPRRDGPAWPDRKGAKKQRHDDLRLGRVAEVDLYGHLVAVLMGPMAAGKQAPVWPPLPDMDGNNDEHVVLTLVSHLKLSKPEYVDRWLG